MNNKVVHGIDELKLAVKEENPLIILQGRRAKRVHRAISAISRLPSLGMSMLSLDPEEIFVALIDADVGFKKFNAVRKLGPRFSMKLTLLYEESGYTKPSRSNNGECILALRSVALDCVAAATSPPPRPAPSIEATVKPEESPLIFRSRRGEIAEVKKLLDSGADIDAQFNGMTALMFAAEQGRLEVVKEVLERGATVDIEDDEGRTALDMAQSRRRVQVARYLNERQNKHAALPSLNGAWLLCDFHIHTSRIGLTRVIDLYGSHGFDVICISDHVYDSQTAERKRKKKGSLYGPAEKKNFLSHRQSVNREADRAMREYDMLVIPGVEITNNTNNYHIGIIDVKDWIDPDRSVEDIVFAAHAQGALAVANHPHRRSSRHLAGNWLAYDSLFDAWEVGNRGSLWDVGANEGLNHIAGGDFHSENDFYSWKTLVRAEKSLESVKKAIRDNSQVALYLFGKGRDQG